MTFGWVQVFALAVLQGVTEFLPISSSAHLILLPRFVDWPDQGLAFDLAVHVGTLFAVVSYFRHELVRMSRDWMSSLRERRTLGESRLAWAVLWGTIPVGLAGLALNGAAEELVRSPALIAATTILFGLLLGAADRRIGTRTEHQLRWRDVFVVGMAQALALIPGTSRSGVTMTAGLFLGLSREGAARFSFLLAIPVTALAGGLKAFELGTSTVPVEWSKFIVGAAIAALTAFLTIHFFLKWLTRLGMWPYVIYRLILGAVILGVLV